MQGLWSFDPPHDVIEYIEYMEGTTAFADMLFYDGPRFVLHHQSQSRRGAR